MATGHGNQHTKAIYSATTDQPTKQPTSVSWEGAGEGGVALEKGVFSRTAAVIKSKSTWAGGSIGATEKGRPENLIS